MVPAILAAKALTCERGYRELFCDLSFELHAGQVMRVVGPNGAGKSTLLNVLAGLSSDYEGEIFWHGESIAACKDDFYANMCFLGHAKAVKRSLTVRENLQWFQALYPCHSDVLIEDVLTHLGIVTYADQLCAQLSAGQQQRVALARLLLSAAQLWVIDEPFTAIDKTGVADFETMISEFVQLGGAVIITTHHDLHLDVDVRALQLQRGHV